MDRTQQPQDHSSSKQDVVPTERTQQQQPQDTPAPNVEIAEAPPLKEKSPGFMSSWRRQSKQAKKAKATISDDVFVVVAAAQNDAICFECLDPSGVVGLQVYKQHGIHAREGMDYEEDCLTRKVAHSGLRYIEAAQVGARTLNIHGWTALHYTCLAMIGTTPLHLASQRERNTNSVFALMEVVLKLYSR
mmetsp:Transcript_23480/g.34798  ORF Transcript_23480/g.34798 Transcript_23480/m.34798 type:complete len:189 (-) Transcript_23480:13-579(-)